MTLIRTPGTIAHAVTVIAGRLTNASAAATAGVKPRTIHDWSHPEATSNLSITLGQAMALDAAYAAAGGEGAPLHTAYAAQLGQTVRQMTACHRELATDLADTSREVGEAIGAATLLIIPGASPNTVQRAAIEIDEAEGAIARLKRRVASFLPGAGPGNPGGAQ